MKQFIYFALFFLFLISCKGSDTYQGVWLATDAEDEQFTMEFKPKQLIINKSDVTDSIGYKQNAFSFENGKSSYGIQLDNGLSYTISFPIAKQKDWGLILTGEEIPVYVINRTKYMTYDEFYKIIN